MPSASRSSVAVSVSASQLIKIIKSVTSLVLKKRQVTAIVCVFYEKRRLKNEVAWSIVEQDSRWITAEYD